MNPFFQYPYKDQGEYPPRSQAGYYDVEKSLERRYRLHQAALKRHEKLTELRLWLIALARRLQHLPYALTHAHPKPVPVYRQHHR